MLRNYSILSRSEPRQTCQVPQHPAALCGTFTGTRTCARFAWGTARTVHPCSAGAASPGAASAGAAFSGAAFSGAAFKGAAFSGTAFSGAAFAGAAFSGAAFAGAAFAGAAFAGVWRRLRMGTVTKFRWRRLRWGAGAAFAGSASAGARSGATCPLSWRRTETPRHESKDGTISPF